MWFIIIVLGILLLYGVWKLLRAIYVKEIFDKIDTADNQLLAITMNLNRVRRDDYRAKITRYESQYEVLKGLSEYLLNSKCWIQNYLMKTEERERCKKVFKDLVNTEKELMACHLCQYSSENDNNEIICSDWFNKWFNSMR